MAEITPPVYPPGDWADVEGWNRYHTGRRGEIPRSDRDLGLQYVGAFRDKGLRRIWFPGGGVSPSARAFAELGFEVLVTDFCPVAVEEQMALASAPPGRLWTPCCASIEAMPRLRS
jgi:hypothetical protein